MYIAQNSGVLLSTKKCTVAFLNQGYLDWINKISITFCALTVFHSFIYRVAESPDFLAFFPYESNLLYLTPDKQAKMVLLKDSFLQRYSQKSDSAHANTARNQTLRRLILRGVGPCTE